MGWVRLRSGAGGAWRAGVPALIVMLVAATALAACEKKNPDTDKAMKLVEQAKALYTSAIALDRKVGTAFQSPKMAFPINSSAQAISAKAACASTRGNVEKLVADLDDSTALLRQVEGLDVSAELKKYVAMEIKANETLKRAARFDDKRAASLATQVDNDQKMKKLEADFAKTMDQTFSSQAAAQSAIDAHERALRPLTQANNVAARSSNSLSAQSASAHAAAAEQRSAAADYFEEQKLGGEKK